MKFSPYKTDFKLTIIRQKIPCISDFNSEFINEKIKRKRATKKKVKSTYQISKRDNEKLRGTCKLH